ncbi:MAG: caspase family protein [Bacteroidota bacterium]
MKRIPILIMLLIVVATTAAIAQCQSGDCKNGSGIYVLPSGAKYMGSFKDGIINGFGTCYYKNGSKYQGYWSERYPEGDGTMTFADKTTWTGRWQKGQPINEMGQVVQLTQLEFKAKGVDNDDIQSGCVYGNCYTGYGTFAYKNGSLYKGEFTRGVIEGHGIFYFQNGDRYEGEFKDGLSEGKGIFYYINGDRIQGTWKAGKYLEDGAIVSNKKRKGCVEGNCKNGTGQYVFRDEANYTGGFKNYKLHGEGKLTYPNGDRYEGAFKDGQFHGVGTLYRTNSEKMEGYWQEGVFTRALSQPNRVVAYPGSSQAKIWAVIVGISHYNHMPTLNYTDDDAYRMFAFYKSPEGGALPDDQIRLLIDEQATRSNIKRAMEELFFRAGPDDLVVLYFSGHGLRGSFLPIDFDGTNNRLYHTEINNILESSHAKFKLCIADACHSGSLLNEEIFAQRSSMENVLAEYYDALAKALPSTALIMSSKSEETSLESNNLRQGVFSHYLLKGLKGSADYDKNRLVSVQELFNYVHSNVRSYTGYRQSPLIQGTYDQKMPVAIVRR